MIKFLGKLLYLFVVLLVRIAMFFYYSIRFEGRENIPKDSDAVIFASNHRSYLDPVVVVLAAPHMFCFAAKEPLFKTPVFAQLIRALGAFPTTWAKDPDYNMLDEAIKHLKNKRYMTIFPEGTRHTDGKVGKGKSGMCVLSAKSGVPIVPVGIIFDSNNLHFRSKICVRLGKPFYPEDYGLTEESNPLQMRQMKDDVMNAIRTMVEENPPFHIIHDEPKKKSSREKAREAREKASKEA
ncbi:MAG: 1-acyl-sn-glycerol-3-phosphate acyltransferase [Ruminococcus sp.]|nr:1-acyl-sn-glycerol-3-phosphate acyltransferase [Ruminococcus sp.]